VEGSGALRGDERRGSIRVEEVGMYITVFTDELGCDIAEALPTIESWGVHHVDLRGRLFGKDRHELSSDELRRVNELLAERDMTVACLETSLAKVHLPDATRLAQEREKLDGIVRAADALSCRLIRTFHYWQPPAEHFGSLVGDDEGYAKVMEMYAPLAARPRAAGLVLAFENCGASPFEVMRVLDGLQNEAWGMAWDVFHSYELNPEDEDAYCRTLAPLARIIHVKARRSVFEGGETLLPYDRILAIAREAGFTGPVSVETHNPDPSVSPIDMTRRIAQAIQVAMPATRPS
jgi:sugar phosphate isomerase/epimerase